MMKYKRQTFGYERTLVDGTRVSKLSVGNVKRLRYVTVHDLSYNAAPIIIVIITIIIMLGFRWWYRRNKSKTFFFFVLQ